MAIFILERNLIGADFDHMLGNHFWAMSSRHAIYKSTLWIVILVKLPLNTWFSLSLKLTFSSQNHYQKFSWRTACLGPCPLGKEGEKVTCPKGKSSCTCPGRLDRGFFEPWVCIFSGTTQCKSQVMSDPNRNDLRSNSLLPHLEKSRNCNHFNLRLFLVQVTLILMRVSSTD